MAAWHFMFGIGIGMLATVLTIVMNARQHRAIKDLPYNDYVAPPNENCPICLSAVTDPEIVYLSCGHAFHKDCLADLRKHAHSLCPICRQRINGI